MLGFAIHNVSGQSMEPKLHDGDYLLTIRPKTHSRLLTFFPFLGCKIGDVVLVNHPNLGLITKRIATISESNSITLAGDSMHSISTDKMGEIAFQHVIGKVIWIIKKN